MRPLPTISQDRTVFAELDTALQKEWLATNGLGGYASSTILGINTRKYHGLLVAALHPPKARRVLLTKLDEEIVTKDTVSRLGANEFGDVFFPEGHRFLEEFSVSPFPTFKYSAAGVEVQKKVFMPRGKNSVVALYDLSNHRDDEVTIRVFPMVNGRGFHDITNRTVCPEPSQRQHDGVVSIAFRNPQSSLLMKMTSSRYFATGHWIEKLYLREEARRGESCFDDCYQPGYFEVHVGAEESTSFGFVAAAEEDMDSSEEELKDVSSTIVGLKQLHDEEKERENGFLAGFFGSHAGLQRENFLEWIVLASDAFVVSRGRSEGRSVIAGYHWFGPWGRDTFISFPGLTLVTDKFEAARAILIDFAGFCQDGLVPNFIPDENEKAAFNTVDATLWYINAVLQYLKYTGDFHFVKRQLWNVLKFMIEKHVDGTLFDIHVENDGLLSHGSQLTWMDSSVGGKPVFPRVGKAVEIQALWYNALKTMALLGHKFREDALAETYSLLAEKAGRNFVEEFWIGEKGFLCDVVNGTERDTSLRPNQILAVSMDFSMLDKTKSMRIVDVVQSGLLTCVGLRTLAKSDPRYVGTYSGDRASRDRAYHSGTVWPWLLGPFITAFLKIKGYVKSQRDYAFENFLYPFWTKQICTAGLGSLSEIYDGDQPHVPRGCISQAWSVAEPLRAYVEDVSFFRPKYEQELLQFSRPGFS